jgi:hypothetical protein
MSIRKFTPVELEDWGLPYDGKIVLLDEIEDTTRWTSVNRLVFTAPDDDKTYMVRYELGLTENQDSEEMFSDPTEGTEVYQQEKVVLVWVATP